jgi:hypothetical protein
MFHVSGLINDCKNIVAVCLNVNPGVSSVTKQAGLGGHESLMAAVIQDHILSPGRHAAKAFHYRGWMTDITAWILFAQRGYLKGEEESEITCTAGTFGGGPGRQEIVC